MVRMISEQRKVGDVPVTYKQHVKKPQKISQQWKQLTTYEKISIPKFHENHLSVGKGYLVIEKFHATGARSK